MTSIDQSAPQAHKLADNAGAFFSGVRAFFAAIGRGIVAAQYARARVVQMEALHAKSDAQLAQIGLKREDIARYVFQDTINI